MDYNSFGVLALLYNSYKIFSAHNVSDIIDVNFLDDIFIDALKYKYSDLTDIEIQIIRFAADLALGRPYSEINSLNTPLKPLLSIFSKISFKNVGYNEVSNDCNRFYKATPLDFNKIIFPEQIEKISITAEDYKNLFFQFKNDIAQLENQYFENAQVFVEKYFSRLPAYNAAGDISTNFCEISMADYMNNTAMLAQCFYIYYQNQSGYAIENLEEKSLLLLTGDFSGIQNFIYNISSKNALYQLRARSFFIELLGEFTITRIMEELSLNRGHLIFIGGGRFYMLLPNTVDSVKKIDDIKFEINEYLYQHFGLTLYLTIAIHAIAPIILKSDNINNIATETLLKNDTAVSDFAAEWNQLGKILNAKKNRKHIEILKKYGETVVGPIQPKNNFCDVCKNDFYKITEEEVENICDICKQMLILGKRLLNVNYIVRSAKPQKLKKFAEVQIAKYYYFFIENYEDIEYLEDIDLLYVINNYSVAAYKKYLSISLLIGNYNFGFETFEEIGTASFGVSKIGVLRMDVDNLGKLFSIGLPKTIRNATRIAALSKELSFFFKIYLNNLCAGNLPESICQFRFENMNNNQNTRRKVLIVYAGGDDVFLIGAWQDVIETSFDIQKLMKHYTCENPDLTISGGMIIISHNFPFYKAAELAGEAEELAKNNGRDSITIFNSAMKWQEAEHFCAEICDNYFRIGIQNRTLIYKLIEAVNIWQKIGIMYLPKLAYFLSRAESQYKLKENQYWFRFKEVMLNSKYISKASPFLNWLSLYIRKKN